MKGTILDFLKLASENPELANELVDLAAKHNFEFSDEVSDEQLDDVAGGVVSEDVAQALIDSEIDGAMDTQAFWKASLATLKEAVERQQDNTDLLSNI